ncbi:MAG: bifunctional DNA-formamidopyrimidine glycosylase/DNA-(apurinic or apyrimidinic site) lyase [Thermoleophilia bacterium]
MPELPEVETVRRRLEPVLVGRRIEAAAIVDERLTRPEPSGAVAAALVGRRVESVGRRGKYLLVGLDDELVLVVHLRMTGSFGHWPDRAPADPHVRATLALDDGCEVTYRDVRRFGTWLLLDAADVEPYLAERLGPEPLGRAFGPRALARALDGRRTAVKAALLDQRSVAGVGNIYADEALWRARIHPLTRAGALAAPDVARLQRAVRAALETGIRRQGATLRDYRDPSGAAGSMQDEFRVYGREGEPCPRCGAPIAKIRVAGRGTWFCPVCQERRA